MTRKKILLKGSFALGAASGDGGAGEAGPRFRLTATHSRPVGIKMQAALAAAAKKRAEKLGIEDEVTRSHLSTPHICTATETGPDRGTASVSLLACVSGWLPGDCLQGPAREAVLVRAPSAPACPGACSPACREHSVLCVAFVRACSVEYEAPAQTSMRACAPALICGVHIRCCSRSTLPQRLGPAARSLLPPPLPAAVPPWVSRVTAHA